MGSSSDPEEDACLSLHGEIGDKIKSHLNSSIICPPVFDRFICWSPTSAGVIASQPCPSIKGSDSAQKAFRICDGGGRWLGKDGIPSEAGWTNYTPCFPPEIREIMRQLGSKDEAQTKLDIAANTRILEIIGLSLSLAALLTSLLIFYKFRILRNPRTRLHTHLFIAMVIQVAIRLTLYIDQAITRANSPTNVKPVGEENLRGIDNTPILCEAGYICLEYARTAMFMWMFVEGLYLHNMITVNVFEEKISPLIYAIIGWVLPIPLTIAWTIVTAINYGTATCWWGYNFKSYFWILEGPRLGVLVVNLAFLLNILRVLVTKLRSSNSSETHQARKAVKAALVLLPLLGLSNFFNMVHAPLEQSAWIFGLWSYSTHLLTSFQGFILAALYCFYNGEVQIALKKYFQTKILGRNKIRFPRSSVRMSLLNHTVVANVDGRLNSPINGIEDNKIRNDIFGTDSRKTASSKSTSPSKSDPRIENVPHEHGKSRKFSGLFCCTNNGQTQTNNGSLDTASKKAKLAFVSNYNRRHSKLQRNVLTFEEAVSSSINFNDYNEDDFKDPVKCEEKDAARQLIITVHTNAFTTSV